MKSSSAHYYNLENSYLKLQILSLITFSNRPYKTQKYACPAIYTLLQLKVSLQMPPKPTGQAWKTCTRGPSSMPRLSAQVAASTFYRFSVGSIPRHWHLQFVWRAALIVVKSTVWQGKKLYFGSLYLLVSANATVEELFLYEYAVMNDFALICSGALSARIYSCFTLLIEVLISLLFLRRGNRYYARGENGEK